MKTPSAQFGVALACLAATLLPACGFGGSSPPPPPDPFSITTSALEAATLDVDYSQTLETANGTAPLTWEITFGTPPPGIDFDGGAGAFTGIPTDIGNSTLVIQVTDSSDPPQTTAAAFLFAVVSSTAGNAILVSQAAGSIRGNGDSTLPAPGTDGRYVAFSSRATTLAGIPQDFNNALDIIVEESCLHQDPEICVLSAARVSLGPVDPDTMEPVEGDNDSTPSSISGDGRFVAFASLATNFIPSDTNNAWDIFVRDTCLGIDPAVCTPTTTRVSVDSGGAEASGDSVEPVISSDGRFIAFRSLANNLVGGDTNGAGDIFVRDTCLGIDPAVCTPTTIRASLASDGSEATGNSLRPAISTDGRFVAFESLASNLTAGDTNGAADIFVRDTCLGAGIGCVPITVRASLANDGSEPNGNSFQTSVSGGGRFVVFESAATDLVTGDTNGFSDAFLRDTCLGGPLGCVPATTRISLDEDGAEFPSISGEPSIDSAGRFIVFTVLPAGLADGDSNGASEIYLRDTCEGGPVDCVPMTTLVSLGPAGERVNGDCSHPVISADGTAVVFQSSATNLISTDTNSSIDIFLVDLVELLTPPPP